MMRVLLWCGGTLVAAAFAGLVLGQFYDLSATRQHPWWVYRALVLYRDTVTSLDASDIEVPDGFAAAADPAGAALFEAHCAGCHGAPGQAPETFALGMMPVPPPLVAAGRKLAPNEIYWFIRNGLKMSGMPAWYLRMSEADMWHVTAFVEALPTLTPAGYASLLDRAGGPAATVAPAQGADRTADPDRGRVALQVHGCRSCHVIPGIVGARVHVGPSLAAAGVRRYLAGVLPNTPANMVRWITDPKGVDPLTLMPDLGVSEGDARDMAAYLYRVAPKPPAAAQSEAVARLR